MTKLYLDPRTVHLDGSCSIRISLTMGGQSIYFPTGVDVQPEEWDKAKHIIKGRMDAETLNLIINTKKVEVDRAVLLMGSRLDTLTARQAKRELDDFIHPEKKQERHRFLPYMENFANGKEKYGTRSCYITTINKIREFSRHPETLTFEEITPEWLKDFDNFLKRTSPSINARNIKLRNIRTIFNDAINNEITDYYPFRRFKFKYTPTQDRSLPIEELQTLFSYPCEEDQKEYIDIFKLILFLAGINMGDLASLTTKNIKGGRIEFDRIKTGQHVSIGIQPETQELLDKYRGKEHLLSIFDKEPNYKTYLHRFNENLKKLGMTYNPHTKKWEGESRFPGISSYWARFSFATLAAELDFPDRVIGAALGHANNESVTSIYIRTDMKKKVDKAVRAVIDYVLYGKC